MFCVFLVVVFFFRLSCGYLCGDNGVCHCFDNRGIIICDSAKSVTEIDFDKESIRGFTEMHVSDIFTCKDIARLDYQYDIKVINSRDCDEVKVQDEDGDKITDVRRRKKKRTTNNDYIFGSTTSIVYVVIDIVSYLLHLLFGVMVLWMYYTARPFAQFLPRRYRKFRKFISFIFRVDVSLNLLYLYKMLT